MWLSPFRFKTSLAKESSLLVTSTAIGIPAEATQSAPCDHNFTGRSYLRKDFFRVLEGVNDHDPFQVGNIEQQAFWRRWCSL